MASLPASLSSDKLYRAAQMMHDPQGLQVLWQFARGAARRRVLNRQLELAQTDLDAAAASDLPTSHYGRNIQTLVAAVQRRKAPRALGSEYTLLRDNMDLVHYYLNNPDVARAQQDAVAHYILRGARMGLSPTPLFNTAVYRTRYPRADASNLTPFGYFLTQGRAQGHIAAPLLNHDRVAAVLGLTPQDALDRLESRSADIRARLETGTLGEMVEKAAHFDPLIRMGWRQATQVRCLPFSSDLVLMRIAALHDMQTAAGFRRAAAVVVLGNTAGSSKPEPGVLDLYLVRALARRFGPDQVVVINTDPAGLPAATLFPAGVRRVDYTGPTAGMASFYKLRPLVEFIRSLRPQICINADSDVMWDLLKVYGKPLTATVDVAAVFDRFNPDMFDNAVPSTARYFYRNFDLLRAVCSDSKATLNALSETFCVPPAQQGKLVHTPVPFKVADRPHQPPAGGPRAISVCTPADLPHAAQLTAIARAHPDLPVEVHAVGLQSWQTPVVANAPANLTLHRHSTHTEVPLRTASLMIAPGLQARRAVQRALAAGLPVAMSAPMAIDLGLDAILDQTLEQAVVTALGDPAAHAARTAQWAQDLATARGTAACDAAIETLLSRMTPAPEQVQP